MRLLPLVKAGLRWLLDPEQGHRRNTALQGELFHVHALAALEDLNARQVSRALRLHQDRAGWHEAQEAFVAFVHRSYTLEPAHES